jgi:hypothetical protein
LLAFLCVECWKLAAKHEPDRAAFTTWASPTLQLRIVDWIRSREAELEGFGHARTVWKFAGYTHVRERPVVISLDDGDRVDETLAARAGDPESDPDPDLGGLLADRDRRRAGDLDELGLDPNP